MENMVRRPERKGRKTASALSLGSAETVVVADKTIQNAEITIQYEPSYIQTIKRLEKAYGRKGQKYIHRFLN